jgi:hypothetical protein
MAITFSFCLGDLDDILGTPTGYPFIQVFYNATGTTRGATAMGAFVVGMTAMGQLTTVAAASRQLWAFSRDNAVPFSSWFSSNDPLLLTLDLLPERIELTAFPQKRMKDSSFLSTPFWPHSLSQPFCHLSTSALLWRSTVSHPSPPQPFFPATYARLAV